MADPLSDSSDDASLREAYGELRLCRDGLHYCLADCSSRPLSSDTMTAYVGPAAAENAGLRPCALCRPERSVLPRGARADARRVRRAALLQLAFDADEAALAATLGGSTARLARDFVARCGVAPASHATVQRRLLALCLLGDTRAPLADVARACGYADEHTLDAELQRHYGATAMALRAARDGERVERFTLALPYAPPYAWSQLLGFLAGRSIDGCEATDTPTGRYRRTLRAGSDGVECTGWIEVVAGDDVLAFTLSPSLLPALREVLARAWHAFDLAAEPRAIAKVLGALARGAPGLRLPGTFDPFELVVRAILGQQITVKAARTLASRFAAAFGTPIATPFADLSRVFPTPAAIAGLSVDAIASLGIIGARARTILAVASALAEGRLHLQPGAELAPTLTALKSLPGIGEWTAQYIAMRALAARDAFPHTDYGVMKALGDKDPKRVLARGDGWRPYRAYAVMHLWRSLG